MSDPNNPANSIPADKRRLGTAMVLAASLCFSTGGLLMKLIPWNPLAINGVRNAISSVVITDTNDIVVTRIGKYVKTLSKLNIRKGVLVSVLVRERKCIIPFGSDQIEAGDTVILTAKAGTVVNLEDAFDLTEIRR